MILSSVLFLPIASIISARKSIICNTELEIPSNKKSVESKESNDSKILSVFFMISISKNSVLAIVSCNDVFNVGSFDSYNISRALRRTDKI